MPLRRFAQVDVFTATPLLGNPVAVVLDGEGLDDTTMQALARWTNLSETTFVTPPTAPTADYRIRIFTPGGELGFAGHPTLGTCHAWLAAGGRPAAAGVVVQEGQVGLVRIRATPPLAFAAPPSTRGEPDGRVLDDARRALGLASHEVEAASVLDNGTDWLALLVPDAARVLAVEPDHAALRALPKIGVLGLRPAGAEPAVEVRAFAASVGVPEDPVTGSLQASAAQWLLDLGRVPAAYEAAQGTRIGREGRVQVVSDGHDVWVGGGTHTVVDGTLALP
jgi:PhzF family phenazine biosynthesis protein